MEKKWYQSKKFTTVIATLAAMMINKYFKLGMNTEDLALLVGSSITYILVQFGLDAKQAKGSYHPLQDPAVRDALESLITDAYDFSMARADGINTHIQSVKTHVFDGLQHLGIPVQLLSDTEDFAKEISRIVLKMYREDQKMKEGADLIRSTK